MYVTRSNTILRLLVFRNFIYFICIASIPYICSSCKKTNLTTQDPDIYYTCSMDPQVVEYKPGKCPICKMELTPVKKNSAERKGEVELSDQQVQLGNIQTDTLRKSIIGDQLVLSGTLNFDQTKASSISVRVMGRIDKLYFKILGEYVKIGTPLMEIYSEDLNNAKQEYLLTLNGNNSFKSESLIDYDQLLQSAKNKLMLWGMTEGQIHELAKNKVSSPTTTFYSTASGYITAIAKREGEYVMEGATLVKLADLSTLWAEAQVYSSQLAEFDIHSLATVIVPDFYSKEIKGKIEFVNPEINPDTRINLIRVSIPNPNIYLKPGMPAYVMLKSPHYKAFILPLDAVIRDKRGATVWIQIGRNSFKNIMVRTGLEIEDRIEIQSGLNEGDVVVISGAHLLHSEIVFKKGIDIMAGHEH